MEQVVLDKLIAETKRYKVDLRLDASFDKLTTFGTGGKIAVALFPDTERKLVKTMRLIDRLGVKYVLLGRGSNVLASDDPFDGVAVVTTKLNRFVIRRKTAVAQCGVSTVALASALAMQGLGGGEFLACLPATVGGATVGNAGCFGQDVKGIARSVTVLKNGQVRRLKAVDCRFAKRDSVFKHSDMTVLSVKFALQPSTEEAVRKRIAEMRAQKAASQPLEYRSAGCVLFHDSVALSRLIDEMGFKGYRVGGAEVSTKHAGFVVNIDKSTSLDIYLIIRRLRRALLDRYGITAKTEVRLINFKEEKNDLFAERKE